MKSMWPPSAMIFFMTYFYRARGAMATPNPPPPGSVTDAKVLTPLIKFNFRDSP